MANKVRLIDLDKACCELERFYNGYTGELRRVASEALDLVCMMPEVDPESLRPKGRWAEKEYGVLYACDQCGYLTDYQLTKFCPVCGAKMEG